MITHEFNVVDHLFNITLVELLCKDRKSRMYFVSMSGECDVWVDEKGCVKRLEREGGEGCGKRFERE